MNAPPRRSTASRWAIAAMVMALSASLAPADAWAKRMGGGRSVGMQRQMPPRAQPTTPPTAQPNAAPNAATPPTTAANPAAATAAAAAPAAAAATARRSWMGPIAGLAAGLGLAALFSHLGLGEGLANFMMMALLAVAAFFVIRMLMARFGNRGGANAGQGSQPAWAGAGAGNGAPQRPTPAARVEPTAPVIARSGPAEPVSVSGRPLAGGAAAAAATAATAATAAVASTDSMRQNFPALPPGFDAQEFSRIAKMIFIRLQAANDSGNLDDIREFTTPEMFAAIRLDLQDRGAAQQTTDVEHVDAELVDFVEEPSRQVASVRYRGTVREEAGAAPVAFDEVWHLVRMNGSPAWKIAGIQQMDV